MRKYPSDEDDLRTRVPDGYNVKPGGDGGWHSPETIERIRASVRKYYSSPEAREKRSIAATKQWSDPEARKAQSERIKGKTRSAATRARMSRAKPQGQREHEIHLGRTTSREGTEPWPLNPYIPNTRNGCRIGRKCKIATTASGR